MVNDNEAQGASRGPALVSETVQRVGWRPATLEPDSAMAAWRPFEASWTEHERAQEVGAWSRARAAEFIAMTAQTVNSMFENSEDAANKALISFAFSMRKAGRQDILVKADFEGSVFGCLRESFHFEARLFPTDPNPVEKLPGSTRSGVIEEAPINEAHEKMRPLWSDASGCLVLWDLLRESLGDKDGTDSARAAALLLVHFDQLSSCNIELAQSQLIGMTDTADDGSTIDTGQDASISTVRAAPRVVAAAGPRARI